MLIDYRGKGCEFMVNHCGDPDKCENGGTCINLAPGFRCDCPLGEQYCRLLVATVFIEAFHCLHFVFICIFQCALI